MKNKKIWVTINFSDEKRCRSVAVKGEWDNWLELKMKQKKNGSFFVRKKIEQGDWEFGFLVDGSEWKTSSSYETVDSPFGTSNNCIAIGCSR